MSEKTLFPPRPILLVDDEKNMLVSYDTVLRFNGYNNITSCFDSREVMEHVRNGVEMVFLDLTMPHISGNELLRQIITEFPETPVIILTGDDTIETAVSCMKTGAFDYQVKPLRKERLISTVKQAINFCALHKENRQLKNHLLANRLESPEVFASMITKSEKMRSIFRYIEAIAESPYPVLILGETGVGKELMAKAVHKASQRKGEFVAVNIAGLDENMFSDTLFGHKKGAFTGADTSRKGLIQKASGGTLFLDEIGDLDIASQIKLLRLLQEGEYSSLGDDSTRISTTRIIVATNKDLAALLQSGEFRNDLYYRLRAHQIVIPPLRDRREDIPLLFDHFMEKSAQSLEKNKPTKGNDVCQFIESYSFPGNIRELQAMVYDMISSNNSKVLSLEKYTHLIEISSTSAVKPPQIISETENNRGIIFGSDIPTMNEAKDLLIDEALKRANGNKTLAAKMLGMTRQAITQRIKNPL